MYLFIALTLPQVSWKRVFRMYLWTDPKRGWQTGIREVVCLGERMRWRQCCGARTHAIHVCGAYSD